MAQEAFKRFFLAALLAASACTSSAPEPASERGPSGILQSAPRNCPLPLLRAASVAPAELQERMQGHLPAWLPNGFGLARAFGPGDGARAGAVWADHDCRQVGLYLYASQASFAGEGPGHRVGDWILIVNEPADCANAVLGKARCLDYRASVEGGSLVIRMLGIDLDTGDHIVRSIPT